MLSRPSPTPVPPPQGRSSSSMRVASQLCSRWRGSWGHSNAGHLLRGAIEGVIAPGEHRTPGADWNLCAATPPYPSQRRPKSGSRRGRYGVLAAPACRRGRSGAARACLRGCSGVALASPRGCGGAARTLLLRRRCGARQCRSMARSRGLSRFNRFFK
jgi:hypothetical protein